jgi:hypothetical protein
MAEWSKDHVMTVGYFNTHHLGLIDKVWLNWRPGRTLREKWRQQVEKVGEWYVESRHLQGCNPCLCRLRTDGLGLREQVLNVPVTCW